MYNKGERKEKIFASKAVKAEEKRERKRKRERERERKTRTCPTSSKLAHMLLIAGVAIVA
jgi:hypothetical protein